MSRTRATAPLPWGTSIEDFAPVFRASPLSISVSKLSDGRVLDANPACTELTGWSREEMLGRTAVELGFWDDEASGRRALDELFSTGKLRGLEHRFRRKSGEWAWGLFSAEVIEHDDEKRVLLFGQDITDQKLGEDLLHGLVAAASRSVGEEFLRTLVVELARALGTRWAMVGRLIPGSRPRVRTVAMADGGQVLDNLEYDLEGTPCECIVGLEMCLFDRGLQERFPADPMLATMGAESLLGAPLVSGNDRPIGLLSVIDDRPMRDRASARSLLAMVALRAGAELERMLAEEKLRESEDRYRSVVSAMGEGVLVLELEAGVVACNASAERIFGVPASEILGDPSRHAYRIIREDGSPFPPAELPAARTFQSGLPHKDVVMGIVRDGKPDCWVSLNAQPMCNPGETRPRAVVLSLSDITERKAYEAARRQLELQLLQAQKMEAIGTLAGGIAHDFNNILAAILGNADLAILDIPARHPAHSCLQEILSASRRAKELVQQILAFSRKRRPEPRPVHVETLVTEALRLMRATLPATVEVQASATGGDPIVLADEGQLHQVLMNLCTNAAHAMQKRGGLLSVETATVEPGEGGAHADSSLKGGPHVRIRVRDSGSGMDAETLARVFDPFFTTKPPGEGTGLGLAVVHGIVRAHDGTIRAESEPGRGSTFEIWLPVLSSSIGSPSPADRRETVSGRDQRILFVDDELPIGRLAEGTLSRLGYRPRSFSRPEEALAELRRDPLAYDLVLTDLTMPGMNGLDLADEVRRLRPGLPVVLSTGHDAPVDRCEARRRGVCGVLHKPYTGQELASAVARGLAVASGRGVSGQEP